MKNEELERLVSENEVLRERLREKAQEAVSLNKVGRALKVISECSRALIRIDNEIDLLNTICQLIVEAGGYPFAWIGFIERGEQTILRPVSHCGLVDEYEKLIEIALCDFQKGQQAAQEASQTGKTYALQCLSKDVVSSIKGDTFAKLDALSVLSLSMMVKGRSFGILNIYAGSSNAFEPNIVELFNQMASDIAFGILSLRARAERHRAEQEKTLLAAATVQAADAIMVMNEQQIIEYVNPAFVKMTGYSREEALGMKMSMFLGNQHSSAFCDRIWETVRQGKLWMGQMVTQKKSGEPLHIEATISPVRSNKGGITNYLAVQRDITHEMDLQAQLRHSQKMEALGTLAGGIAHDFNNILGIIMGFAELAIFELPEECEARRHLNDARKAGHRATRLVKQILAFSRAQEQTPGPIQMSLVVKEALKMLRSTLPSTIEMRQEIDSTSQVMGDPSQVHQIIMNLCTNAYHAMRERGGVMTVSLKDVHLVEAVTVGHLLLAPGHYLELTVEDTGHGIAPSISEKIFDPYFTTKSSEEGSGLGLAVVHGIVKSLGGAISFQSEIGKKTEFRILLPGHDAQVHPEGKTDELITKGNQEQVLFIDDEEQLVFLAERMLQRLGYQVTGYSSSVQALQEFRANPRKFDIIITDMTMPHMTGIQLASEFLRIRPDIPLILCTGYSDMVNYERAKAAGFKAFIMKPLGIAELARAVGCLLAGVHNDSSIPG